MARTTHGGAYEARGRFFMRVTIATAQRRAVALPWVTPALWEAHAPGDAPCPCMACVRARDVQELVTTYRAGGADREMLESLLKSASTADAEKMAAIGRAVAGFCEGKIPKAKPKADAEKDTFRGVAERWTSGELHRLHPDHVRAKRSATDDEYRLEILYETGIGRVPVAQLTIDNAEHAMRDLDAARERIEQRRAADGNREARPVRPLEAGGRRQYAQLISMVLGLSAYPLRLITVSPLPRGWLPKVPTKAKGIPYPDEEAAVLGDADHVIHWRVFFGSLTRSGFRADEMAGLNKADVDVDRGIVTLDENKTDDPRSPSYGEVPGLMRALR